MNGLYEAVLTGGISVFVSIVTSLATVFVAMSRASSQRRQTDRRLTERLYWKRLSVYQDAFIITNDIGKIGDRESKMIVGHHKDVLRRLAKWESEQASLVLSEKSLQSFYFLTDALKKNPSEKNQFSREQILKLWQARNSFRGSLRADVGLLFNEV